MDEFLSDIAKSENSLNSSQKNEETWYPLWLKSYEKVIGKFYS